MFNLRKIVLFSLATLLSAQFSAVMAPTTLRVVGRELVLSCEPEFKKPTSYAELVAIADKLDAWGKILQASLFHSPDTRWEQYAAVYEEAISFLGLQVLIIPKSEDPSDSTIWFLGLEFDFKAFDSASGRLFQIKNRLKSRISEYLMEYLFSDIDAKKTVEESAAWERLLLPLVKSVYNYCSWQWQLTNNLVSIDVLQKSPCVKATKEFFQYYEYFGKACTELAKLCKDFPASDRSSVFALIRPC